jgi:hypothetical protein
MKPTLQSTAGTSFFNDVFLASVNDLRKIAGVPSNQHNDGKDKVNFEWKMETEDGEVFTIYDWKEYRVIDEDELIEWHIGAHNEYTSDLALNEIADVLNVL